MLEARKFVASDHMTVVEWWKSHGWPAIPLETLPERGFVVDDTAAVFLYVDQKAPLGILEFMVTNPKRGLRERVKAIESLLDAATKEADRIGLTTMLGYLTHKSLIKKYLTKGFKQTDSGMTGVARLRGTS